MLKRSVARCFSDAVEDLMSYLNCSDWQPRPNVFHSLRLSHFDGAHALLPESAASASGFDGLTLLNPAKEEGIDPSLFGRNFDCRTLTANDAPADHGDPAGFDWRYQLTRVRSVPLRSVRGLYRLVSPLVFEAAWAHINENGRYWTSRTHLTWSAGRFLRLLPDGQPTVYDEKYDEIARLNISMQLALEYNWSVSLGLENCPRLSFVTDPSGVRAFFRLRDLAEGRSRRDALVHWVTSHWRRNRSDEEDTIWVKESLRGVEHFSWAGYRCTIYPSQSDMKRAGRPSGAEESLTAAA